MWTCLQFSRSSSFQATDWSLVPRDAGRNVKSIWTFVVVPLCSIDRWCAESRSRCSASLGSLKGKFTENQTKTIIFPSRSMEGLEGVVTRFPDVPGLSPTGFKECHWNLTYQSQLEKTMGYTGLSPQHAILIGFLSIIFPQALEHAHIEKKSNQTLTPFYSHHTHLGVREYQRFL